MCVCVGRDDHFTRRDDDMLRTMQTDRVWQVPMVCYDGNGMGWDGVVHGVDGVDMEVNCPISQSQRGGKREERLKVDRHLHTDTPTQTRTHSA